MLAWAVADAPAAEAVLLKLARYAAAAAAPSDRLPPETAGGRELALVFEPWAFETVADIHLTPE